MVRPAENLCKLYLRDCTRMPVRVSVWNFDVGRIVLSPLGVAGNTQRVQPEQEGFLT